jgi:hypothetical protein
LPAPVAEDIILGNPAPGRAATSSSRRPRPPDRPRRHVRPRHRFP